MKKVEIIKIPYKPFRKKLYELFEDSQGNPLLTYRKILYEFQRRRDSGKSLISFSIKSYMNKRGGRRSSRISLISFSEKS